MLLAELATFTNSSTFFFREGRKSDDNSFHFHVLKLMEIDVADSLVPQLQVSFDSEALANFTSFDFKISNRCSGRREEGMDRSGVVVNHSRTATNRDQAQ